MNLHFPPGRRSSPDASRRAPASGGFTLIEMLVTTVLTAVLLAALLGVTAGISRDRKRLAAADDGARPEALVELLRRDLTNARTLGRSADGRGIVLEGHGGLTRGSLLPNGRLTRVTYRVRSAGLAGGADGRGRPCLVREQRYLDDPVRPEPWAEVVAVGARRITIIPAGGPAGDALPAGEPEDDLPRDAGREEGSAASAGGAVPAPAAVRLGVALDAAVIDELIRIR